MSGERDTAENDALWERGAALAMRADWEREQYEKEREADRVIPPGTGDPS